MRLDDQRRSDNIEDRRGQRGGGGLGGGIPGMRMGSRGGLGIGGLVIIGLLMLFFPQARPLLGSLLGMGGGGGAAVEQQAAGPTGAPKDETGDFLAAVLGSTEDVWQRLFAEGKLAHYGYNGREYPAPTLVPFSGATGTACGTGQAAMGPFYCPGDQKVYIDTVFFQQLKDRFQAPGDFAQAYVIAHEVGHHIQTVIGISEQVQSMRARAGEREGNALQVRMELQADCFAGVWARSAADWKRQLESGDIEEALNAANAIGDDTLQKQARGFAVPDSFTHGSSDQRKRWFNVGVETGDPAACDTFNARSL